MMSGTDNTTNNVRNTQFKGFAKLLLQDMLDMQGVDIDEYDDNWKEVWEEVITRRAYDFACRVAKYVGPPEWDDQRIAEMMEYVTDLTELPKEQEQ